MKIQIRATYQNEAKNGLITISKMVGNKPIEYALQLFENNPINLTKTKFSSIPLAIAHASLYGFLVNLWDIIEMDS